MLSKIWFLKFIDRVFGTLLAKLLVIFYKPPNKLNNDISSILVIRPGGIGDAVLLFPALEALKINYPDSSIDVLAEKRNAGIFSFCPFINNLYLYDTFNFFNVFNKKYDVVFDTEQWHKLSSIVGYLVSSGKKIGFNTNSRSQLYTESIKYSHKDHEVVSFLNLVKTVCRNVPEFKPSCKFINFSDNEIREDLRSEVGRINNIKIGLFYGATVRERMWGVDKFSLLANELIKLGFTVILLGGNSDIHQLKEFMENIKDKENILNFIGKTNLKESAYILSKLELFISGDSGLMHIAYGLGTRTISLFGVGIEQKWAPKGKKNIIINKNLECSPCTKFGYTPRCPYEVRCLKDISTGEVLKEVLKLYDLSEIINKIP